ncbi:hypothetical protein PTKIN_Ptkin13bG0109900 [Pterospermum kingtungense]
MATNKERIAKLEASFEGFQTSLSYMEGRLADRIQKLEQTISKLSSMIFASKETANSVDPEMSSLKGRSRNDVEEVFDDSEEERPLFCIQAYET